MSIYENAVSGLRFNGVKKKSILDEAAETSLKSAALWDSVQSRLKVAASNLSGASSSACASRAPSPWTPRCS